MSKLDEEKRKINRLRLIIVAAVLTLILAAVTGAISGDPTIGGLIGVGVVAVITVWAVLAD